MSLFSFQKYKKYLARTCNQSAAFFILLLLIISLSIPQTQHLITRIRNASYDFYQRLNPREYKESPVKIVSIDNQSLEKMGQFPWSRLKIAELIGKLDALGAKVIVFDMLFSEPDRTSPKQLMQLFSKYPEITAQLENIPDNDDVLTEAIKNSTVVTSFMLRDDRVETRLPESKAGVMIKGVSPFPILNCVFPNAMTSLKKIEQAAKGNGTVTYVADEDGVIRNVPLWVCLKDKLSRQQYRLSPSIGLEAVRLFKNQKHYTVQTNEIGRIKSVRIGKDFTLKTNPTGHIWLHYTPELNSRYIPAWKIFEDKINSAEIDGKIVFIGVTASNLLDMRFNPFGHIIAGVEVHAQLVEQLLQNTYLHEFELESVWVCLLWMIITGFFYAIYQKIKGIYLFFWVLAIVSVVVGISWTAFIQLGLLIDPIIPSFGIVFLFISFFIQKQLKTENEKRWLREAFGRYISPNRVKYLIEHPDSLTLGGEYRECTFVMTDLANFTALMEKHPPHECVEMLNHYLDGMIEIAFKHHGTLDRIVGDAVAVIFSAPIIQENHRHLALQCALEMDDYAMGFARDKGVQGIKFGITRIGVCTGKVLIGNFGGKTMFDYRALGDPINTASRLESVNKQFGTRLCVAESTLESCKEFKSRPIGGLVLKGKTKTIQAFELLSQQQFESSLTREYLNAYQQLDNNDAETLNSFKKLVEKYPDDALSRYHYQRLQNQHTGTTIVLKDK